MTSIETVELFRDPDINVLTLKRRPTAEVVALRPPAPPQPWPPPPPPPPRRWGLGARLHATLAHWQRVRRHARYVRDIGRNGWTAPPTFVQVHWRSAAWLVVGGAAMLGGFRLGWGA